MAGNVDEWCADWYDPNYYRNAPPRNPAGPSKAVSFIIPDDGDYSGVHVLRGGSWLIELTDNFRCAHRYFRDPTYRKDSYGFRCAMSP